MRFFPLLLLPLLVATAPLTAQEAPAPLLMHASGKATYQLRGQSPRVVRAGDYLTGEGQLILGDRAEVEMIHLGKYLQLDGPERFAIPQVFAPLPEPEPFLRKFTSFLSRRLQAATSWEHLVAAYESNRVNIRNGSATERARDMSGTLPFGGKLAAQETVFRWPPLAGAAAYHFLLADSLTETPVLTARLRDTSLLVHLEGLALNSGQRYFWEVRPASATDAAPLRVYVTFEDVGPQQLLPAANNFTARFSHAQAHLLDAMQFEDLGFLYAADLAYRAGLQDEPGEPILLRTYAAFLARWNLLRDAEILLTTPVE